MLQAGLKIHFIGIGGVGMSGLAKVFLEKGMTISGSDIVFNNYTADLSSQGAKIFKGHRASHIRDVDVVTYSSSIRDDNIELAEARRLKKFVLSRLGLFQEFTNGYTSIMVTGTHGKTTTAAIISHILLTLGLDPTVLLGGDMSPFGNARLGKSEYLVAELDESDGEFVKVRPTLAIITNIEDDHLDCFGSFSKLKDSFKKFIKNLTPGRLIFFKEDKNLQKFKFLYRNSLSPWGEGRVRGVTFGFNSGCDYEARELSIGPESHFSFYERGKLLGNIHVPIPGRHNIINALSAVSAALTLGLKFNKVREALSHFGGVARRFELKGEVGGIKVIEDYAHHPTEIKATLAAARLYRPIRILAIFQPHRYTRTKSLMDEFSLSFFLVDTLAITEIYGASERNISHVSSKDIVKGMASPRDAHFFKTPEEAAGFIVRKAKEGDMIFILGAGDVNRISERVLEDLRQR